MIMKTPPPETLYSLLKRPDMQPFPKRAAMAEERRLFEALGAGDPSARETLIKANTKFAAKVARLYAERGLPSGDLFSEAVIGLTRAVDRFDASSGYKFITYAVWWIRQAILMALAEQSRTFKVPTALFGLVRKIDRARSRLEQELGRTASAFEIAEVTKMSVHDVADIQRISDGTISLTRPTCGPEGDCTLQDILPGDNQTDAGVIAESRKKLIGDLLTTLKPKEREVMRRYYGLDYGSSHRVTLDDVGQQMGLTRERVRQLKESALKTLQRRAQVRGVGVDE